MMLYQVHKDYWHLQSVFKCVEAVTLNPINTIFIKLQLCEKEVTLGKIGNLLRDLHFACNHIVNLRNVDF